MTIAPVRTRVAAPAGGLAQGVVSVRNGSSRTVEARVEVGDWTIEGGSAAGLQVHPPGSQARSLAPYLQLEPRAFSLAPGEARDIQFSIALPAEARGSYFAALLVTLDGAAPVTLAGGLAVGTRIAYRHLVTADTEGRTRFAAAVERFAVSRPDDTAALEVRALLRNTGDAGLRPEGSVALVDDAGRLIAKLPVGVAFAQPGGTLELVGTWDGTLEPGRHQALATIDLGGGVLLTPEIAFEVEDRIEIEALAVDAGGTRATLSLSNPGHFTHTLSGEAQILGDDGSHRSLTRIQAVLLPPGGRAEVALDWLEPLAPGAVIVVRVEDAERAFGVERRFETSSRVRP